jgi:hypothetical protein
MKTMGCAMIVLLVCIQSLAAQEAAAPAPAPAPAAGAPAQPAPVQRVQPPPGRRPIDGTARFDIVITDTAGGKPVTKSLTLTVGNQGQGSIRTSARVPENRSGVVTAKDDKGVVFLPPPAMIPLNVDVRGVTIFPDNSVRAQIVVEYQPYVADADPQPAVVSASSTSEFANGRRVTILQSADPISDRRTTIEVTATILK